VKTPMSVCSRWPIHTCRSQKWWARGLISMAIRGKQTDLDKMLSDAGIFVNVYFPSRLLCICVLLLTLCFALGNECKYFASCACINLL